MTLVVTVNGPESIWVLADRRLSHKGRPTKDDARKIMFLESTDGVAILAYSGLGATALGTEPADWMSAVLRGRKLSLEQSLGVLAEAMKKQLPRHMVKMLGPVAPVHNVIVPAFLGNEPRLYTIDLAFAPDRKTYRFRYTRHVNMRTPAKPRTPPPLSIGGSGAMYLIKCKTWMRSLLRVTRAYNRGQVSARVVADHLANLNQEVHLGISDNSVGPRCIVAWRNSKEGIHKGGGGHQFYTGTTRDAGSPSLPTIASGFDVNALVGAIVPHINFEAIRTGDQTKALNKDELNEKLALLPDKPDEKLR